MTEGTIVLVHGTGVRLKNYRSTFDKAKAAACGARHPDQVRRVRMGTVWVPDVDLDPDYVREGPATASALVIPLLNRANGSVVGVVDIELAEVNALSVAQIAWLEEFVSPIAAWLADTPPRVALTVESTYSITGAVTSLAATADGSLIVAGGDYQGLALWGLGTADAPEQGHPGPVSCVTVSADGRVVTTGDGDDQVRMWDRATGTVYSVSGPGSVTAVALTPDARRFIAAFSDGTVGTGDQIFPTILPLFGKGDQPLTSLAVYPDNRRAVGISKDGRLSTFDLVSGKLLSQQVLNDSLQRVAITPDGRRAVIGAMSGSLYVWDLETEKPLFDIIGAHKSPVTGLAVAHPGWAVSTSMQEVRFWDLQTGEALSGGVDSGPFYSCALADGGRRILVGGDTKSGVVVYQQTGLPVSALTRAPAPTLVYSDEEDEPPYSSWARIAPTGREDEYARFAGRGDGSSRAIQVTVPAYESVSVRRSLDLVSGYVTCECEIASSAPTGHIAFELIPVGGGADLGGLTTYWGDWREAIRISEVRSQLTVRLPYDLRTLANATGATFAVQAIGPAQVELTNIRWYSISSVDQVPLDLHPSFATALARLGDNLAEFSQFDEQLATYDSVVAQFGLSPIAAVRQQVARALINKAGRLGALGRTDEEIKVYDEVASRFGDDGDAQLVGLVVEALINKAGRLGVLERFDDELSAYDDVVTRLEPRLEQTTDPGLRDQLNTALTNKAGTLNKLGERARIAGDLVQADNRLSECLSIRLRFDDQPGAAAVLVELSRVAMSRPRDEGLANATELLQRAQQIYQEAQSPCGEAETLYRLGIIARRRGKVGVAFDFFARARRLFILAKDERGRGRVLCQRGLLYVNMGDLPRAKTELVLALDIAFQVKDEIGAAFASYQLGRLAERQGDLENARQRYADAERWIGKHHAPRELELILYAQRRLASRFPAA
jgi:tetratricopeptide (TPR) repeat protein